MLTGSKGPRSQGELRGLLEVFLLTQPIPTHLQDTLRWMVADYCDIVCGSGMLAVPNTYADLVDGPHWDFVVSATSAVDRWSRDLTLSYRGHRLGLWYRLAGRQPIVIANPELLDRQPCYRVRRLQLHHEDIVDRSGAKTALANPVHKALFPQ